MNILIFNWRDLKHSWAGGGEIYIFEQAKRWVKMGHQVTVFCGQDREAKLPKFEKNYGVEIYRKGNRFSLYFWAIWFYLREYKRKAQVIVDVENGIPFFTPFFCRIPKVCYVYHVHGKQFFYALPFPLSGLGYLIEKYLFPIIYRNIPIIAISETTRYELIKIGFKKEKIKLIHCGMNMVSKPISAKFNKFLNPTILYLGRIKAYKRVELLVKIFPQVLKKIPRARLIIAGWGTEASDVANAIMKSPHRRKITLLGPVSNQEKKALLARSWLFVNPSIGEGWSIAVIEANSLATPAIAFDVPGLRDSIRHNKTGLLANDENDLVDKICLVLGNKKYCETLSSNALEWSKRFNWDKTASNNIELLKKIVIKKKSLFSLRGIFNLSKE